MLGLIFLKFADNKYRQFEAAILAEYQKLKGSRREKKLSDIAIEQCGFYLPDHARYGHLLNLPEEEDIAKALKRAMEAIEDYKPELAGVLPQDEYFRLTRSAQNQGLAQRLQKIFSDIPLDAGGDLFGKIYEYLLANFAMSEGQGGGEFFTPRSVVKLMVENRAYCLIYEPPENLVASTGFAVISPGPSTPFTFINFAVTSDSFVEQMAMVAKGSAYPTTSFEDFEKAKVLLPSTNLLNRFHGLCEPMFRRRHQLRGVNTALARQRDAHLLRLISGKLAVDALDIRFPPGMRLGDKINL